MENSNNITNISLIEEILKKIKRLESDKIYSYKILNQNSDKLRVYISRLADRGIIVKTAYGRFYKPTRLTAIKRSTKEIELNKGLFTNDLFWNVKDGFKIKVSTLIRNYLKEYSEDDLMGLYSLFGYTRLIEESLKLYRSRRDEDYQKIREILMQFDRWRLDEK